MALTSAQAIQILGSKASVGRGSPRHWNFRSLWNGGVNPALRLLIGIRLSTPHNPR
jgi:hypothetical protein